MTDKKAKKPLNEFLEEALFKLSEVHPALPQMILDLYDLLGKLRDAKMPEKITAIEERLDRFEQIGGAAILKLKRMTDRLVRKEEREERRLQKATDKAVEKAAK